MLHQRMNTPFKSTSGRYLTKLVKTIHSSQGITANMKCAFISMISTNVFAQYINCATIDNNKLNVALANFANKAKYPSYKESIKALVW